MFGWPHSSNNSVENLFTDDMLDVLTLKVGFCLCVIGTLVFSCFFSAMTAAPTVEVVDLECEMGSNVGLLSKHLGKSLPSAPALAAPPLLSQVGQSQSSIVAPSSTIASTANAREQRVSDSQNMPDMLVKFQVSAELQKFLVKPPTTESCFHFCSIVDIAIVFGTCKDWDFTVVSSWWFICILGDGNACGYRGTSFEQTV